MDYLGSGTDVHEGVLFAVRPRPTSLRREAEDRRRPSPPRLAPPPYESLLHASPDRTATLEMIERATPVVRDGNAYTDYGLEVVQGDARVVVGDVVEWTVVNERKGDGAQDTNHPFHLHTNHFQIVSVSRGAGVDYRVGDWRDTITLPTPGRVTVRFKADRYDGPTIAHCHIFSHADLGMAHHFAITEDLDVEGAGRP